MSGRPPDTDLPRPPRRDLRNAWISVILVPIGFALAMLIGEKAMDLLGYTAGGDRVAPGWVEGLIGIPVTVIGILPGASAAVFGLRARRGGIARGIVPAVVGGLVVLYWGFVIIAGLLGVVF